MKDEMLDHVTVSAFCCWLLCSEFVQGLAEIDI